MRTLKVSKSAPMTDGRLRPVENPPHVDERRSLHISTADLAASLTQGLAAGDPSAQLAAFRQRMPNGRAPVWDTRRWALASSGGPTALDAIRLADELLHREVDFLDRSLGRSRLYGFHYLSWMAPLVRAYALTGDSAYAACWERFFVQWYASREHVRGDWSGLDVIWYSLGVCSRSAVLMKALPVFAVEPAVSDRAWQQMLATVIGGARWATEEHQTFRHGNWQFVSAVELLHVAGVLADCPEAAQWEEVARARLLDHLELDVYADGGHFERSPGYHAMCLGGLHRAASIAEQHLSWDLVQHPRFRAMHDWLITMSAPTGWIPPLQDSGVVWPAALLVTGHYFFDDPAYKALAQRWLSPESIHEQLAWLPPRPGVADPLAHYAESPSQLPSAAPTDLPGSGYTVFRDSWDPDAVYTVINHGPHTGHELESHSHRASLDFVLVGHGVPLAWEAGKPPSYDDPSYHDWHQASRGHNTVVIPGREMSEDREATVSCLARMDPVTVFAGSHRGYGSPHLRRITFVGGAHPYWLITDDVDHSEDSDWLLHAVHNWLPDGAGFRTAGSPGLLVLPTAPDLVESVHHSSGPSSLPTPGGHRAGVVHTLALRRSAGSYATVLVPYRDRAPAIAVGVGDTSAAGQHTWIELAGERDLHTADAWVRCRGDGSVRSAARWSSGPLLYGGHELVGGDSLQTCAVEFGRSRVGQVTTATVQTLRSGPVRIAAGHPGITRLNGVPLTSTPMSEVEVRVPSAGLWRIEHRSMGTGGESAWD